ncbi:hypothetical protein BN1013_00037 [Candidatus Rubidus massiliensis]|nr:hypothetical protein BN1013_00037 [Candidatus Rubidus massiliensis]
MKYLIYGLAACLAFVIPYFFIQGSIEEGNNVFNSSLYRSYHQKLQKFANNYSMEEIQPNSINALFKYIRNSNQVIDRQYHETLVDKIRQACTYYLKEYESINGGEKNILEQFIIYLFLGVDTTDLNKRFFYEHIDSQQENLLSAITSVYRLREKGVFQGIKKVAFLEDQFTQGNIPSRIDVLDKTILFRCGQPFYQFPPKLWWLPLPLKMAPEFALFLKLSPNHLYINLMRRKGMEGKLSHYIEALEELYPHLTVVSLDKNSPFYWQKGNDVDIAVFKNDFLKHLQSSYYYWSKKIVNVEEILQCVLQETQDEYFAHKDRLNASERNDFIELAYLKILDRLVVKIQPITMNITCRQAMDRGPSLMALWLYKKNKISSQDILPLLMAQPMLIHNRLSIKDKINRFISAAQRLDEVR